MAAERPHRGDRLLAAVVQARRVRGSVNVEPADQRRWSAVVAATDGSLELRVADPPRRGLRGKREQTRWLREHGFERAEDCWVLPLDRATSDEAVAERWAAALADGLEVDPATVRTGYVGHGSPADPSAPHEAHIVAALDAILGGGFDRVNVFGGRPSRPWAWIWDEGDALLIEVMHEEERDDKDEWRVPRTPEGCRDGAHELLRRLRLVWAEVDGVPLFIHLLEPRQ